MPSLEDPIDDCARKICDIVQVNVIMVATCVSATDAPVRAAKLYLAVRDYCDFELDRLQGPRDPILRRIEKVVAELYHFRPHEIRVESRVWPKPQARGMMFLLLHETGCTLARCAEISGVSGRTIKYRIRAVRNEMSVNPELSDIYVKAKNRLRSHE